MADIQTHLPRLMDAEEIKRLRIIDNEDDKRDDEDIVKIPQNAKNVDKANVHDAWIQVSGIAKWMLDAGIPCYWHLKYTKPKAKRVKATSNKPPAPKQGTGIKTPTVNVTPAKGQGTSSDATGGGAATPEAGKLAPSSPQGSSRNVSASLVEQGDLISYYRWGFGNGDNTEHYMTRLKGEPKMRSANAVIHAIRTDYEMCKAGSQFQIPLFERWKIMGSKNTIDIKALESEARVSFNKTNYHQFHSSLDDVRLVTLLRVYQFVTKQYQRLDLQYFEPIVVEIDPTEEQEQEEKPKPTPKPTPIIKSEPEPIWTILDMSKIWPPELISARKRSIHAIGSALASWMEMPPLEELDREVPVERFLGALIHRLIKCTGCLVLSTGDSTYPTALGCFGSIARPDLAARIYRGVLSILTVITFIGEAKIKNDPIEKVLAQLAFAVQPSLQLFAIHLTKTWKEEDGSDWRYDHNPFQAGNQATVPDWMRIYGIIYHREGIRIVCHFPYYTIDKDKIIWGFQQVTVYHAPFRPEKFNKTGEYEEMTMFTLAEMLRAILVAKQGAETLARRLEEEPLNLPEELLTLEDIWLKRKFVARGAEQGSKGKGKDDGRKRKE